MDYKHFNLNAELQHLEALLTRIQGAVEAANELPAIAGRIQSKMSAMPFAETEEERDWIVALQKKADKIANKAHSVPIILWSVARASIDIQGDLVKSIEAMKEPA